MLAAGPSPKPGPSPTQTRFLEIWNLDIWKFGIQKIKKIEILKIQIRSAKNVGKVWISKKNLLAPFGAIRGYFFLWTGKNQKTC